MESWRVERDEVIVEKVGCEFGDGKGGAKVMESGVIVVLVGVLLGAAAEVSVARVGGGGRLGRALLLYCCVS